MDYEKAYLEALDRAKAGKSMNEVFPELKESEDERIKKFILASLNYLIGIENSPGSDYDKQLKEAYHWLEKQKEQKPAKDTVLQKAFINSKIDYTLEEKCDASDYAEVILPTSAIYGESEEEYKLHKIIEAAFIAGRKKDQQPVEWSDSVAKEMFIKALERAVEQTKKGYELTDCDKHSWWEDFKACSEIKPAEWMAGQGESRECTIGMATEEIHCLLGDGAMDAIGIGPGDKIIVQIRKK